MSVTHPYGNFQIVPEIEFELEFTIVVARCASDIVSLLEQSNGYSYHRLARSGTIQHLAYKYGSIRIGTPINLQIDID